MEFLPFHTYHLTEEMVERAEKELGETSETRKRALDKMRQVLKEDKKLDCPLDDNYLLQYLRSRKFDLTKAVGALKNYYTVKKNYKDVYGIKNFEALMKVCREKLCIVLPYRDVDGAILMVVQLKFWNVAELNFATAIHALTCLIVGCVDLHPASQICGVKLIFDIKGLGVAHLLNMSPRIMHMAAQGMANCLPVRFQAFHIFNESVVVKYLWKFLNVALPAKLKQRVNFHASSLESLHSKINPALLPESLGGTLVYDNIPWLKTVEKQKDRYLELMSCGFESET